MVRRLDYPLVWKDTNPLFFAGTLPLQSVAKLREWREKRGSWRYRRDKQQLVFGRWRFPEAFACNASHFGEDWLSRTRT